MTLPTAPKTKMKPLLILALVGWLNALWQLWHRTKLLSEGQDAPSFCNVNSFINCDSVSLSEHAIWFGMPVSALGMLFYSILILVLLTTFFKTQNSKSTEETQNSFMLIWSLALFGLIPTLIQAYTSLVILKALCFMCAISYVLNVSIAILAWKLPKRQPKMESLISGIRQHARSGWIIGLVLTAFHLFLPTALESSFAGNSLDAQTLALFANDYDRQPVFTFQDEGSASWGASASQAKVTLVEFSDFQCPYCAKSAATLPAVLAPYKNQVRVIFKNYPLDPTCNPEMKGSGGHRLACRIAKVAHCSFLEYGSEAFYQYKSELFSHQATISETKLWDIAEQQGLDVTKLKECAERPQTHQAIVNQIQEGTLAKVQSTPSIFMNGKLVRSGALPKPFQILLQRTLRTSPQP